MTDSETCQVGPCVPPITLCRSSCWVMTSTNAGIHFIALPPLCPPPPPPPPPDSTAVNGRLGAVATHDLMGLHLVDWCHCLSAPCISSTWLHLCQQHRLRKSFMQFIWSNPLPEHESGCRESACLHMLCGLSRVGLGMPSSRLGPAPSFACASSLGGVWCPMSQSW